MNQPVLLVLLGILIGIGIWQLVVWLGEIRQKNKSYKAASAYAQKNDKPMLVAGGPWGGKPFRHMLKMPAHGAGDVCLDIDRNAIKGHPNGVIADITHIPFADGSFSSVFASHLLEHLATVEDARKALNELQRVAESVHIVCPSRQSIAAWIIPGHHLWVWQKDNKTFLKQRGKTDSNNTEVHTVEPVS